MCVLFNFVFFYIAWLFVNVFANYVNADFSCCIAVAVMIYN
jgi:hypothetical protein